MEERYITIKIFDCITYTMRTDTIGLDWLPDYLHFSHPKVPKEMDLRQAVEDLEIEMITEGWHKYGVWSVVAEKLGIPRATLYRKLQKYGLLTIGRTNEF